MADGIWVGMSGAVARAKQLEAVADNLANAQTPGFKASHPAFETFLAGQDSQEPQLALTGAVSGGVDLRNGATLVTNTATDVLPQDGTFLSVSLPDQTVGFTRDGRIVANDDGQLSIGGKPVRGSRGEHLQVPPNSKLSFDSNGAVLADGVEVGRLATYRLAGPIERLTPSVIRPITEAGVLPAETRIKVGELELSNSSPLEGAVAMISAQRNFDTSMQAVQTYKRMDDRANEIGRVR